MTRWWKRKRDDEADSGAGQAEHDDEDEVEEDSGSHPAPIEFASADRPLFSGAHLSDDEDDQGLRKPWIS